MLARLHPVDEPPVEHGIGLAHARQGQLGKCESPPVAMMATRQGVAATTSQDAARRRSSAARWAEAPRRSSPRWAPSGGMGRVPCSVFTGLRKAWSTGASHESARSKSAASPRSRDLVRQPLVKRIALRHVVEHLVEGLGVILHHALHVAPDAHADGRHRVEGKRVEVVVRHHDEERPAAAAVRRSPHPGDLRHALGDLPAAGFTTGAVVVVGSRSRRHRAERTRAGPWTFLRWPRCSHRGRGRASARGSGARARAPRLPRQRGAAGRWCRLPRARKRRRVVASAPA